MTLRAKTTVLPDQIGRDQLIYLVNWLPVAHQSRQISHFLLKFSNSLSLFFDLLPEDCYFTFCLLLSDLLDSSYMFFQLSYPQLLLFLHNSVTFKKLLLLLLQLLHLFSRGMVVVVFLYQQPVQKFYLLFFLLQCTL